jgi:hypothetical protein
MVKTAVFLSKKKFTPGVPFPAVAVLFVYGFPPMRKADNLAI